jgi:hypothetical protein
MLDGENSVFTAPDNTFVGLPSNDNYTPISFPNSGVIILNSKYPVELTQFDIRVNEICSDNGALTIAVTYHYGDNSETVVWPINYPIQVNF